MALASYRPAVEADLPALAALFNASNLADGLRYNVDASELAEELNSEHTSLAADTLVAVDDGAVVGFVFTRYLPSETIHERCFIDGTVGPDHRGRGIGRDLVTWAVDHTSELLGSSGRDLPRRIQVQVYEQRPADVALFARFGFQPVRWFDDLRRPLTELPDPVAVEGISIVGWPEDRDDELLDLRNATFADHWGSTPMSAAVWREDVYGYGARRDLSFVAVDDGDRVVGMSANARFESDDEVSGRRDGWIMTLGTLAEWRRRGVASGLLVASMHAFADAGLTHAALGVDSDSPTGAARLYRSLGFEPAERSIRLQLQL